MYFVYSGPPQVRLYPLWRRRVRMRISGTRLCRVRSWWKSLVAEGGCPVSAWKSAAITPSAARLTESLRDIGYDFPAAVADIVDNSVMAGAAHVDVSIEFAGEESYVVISDDGEGMTANGLVEALRYGSRRTYGRSDLGRYGLGLKTASLSQCRSVTVVTCRRAAPGNVTRADAGP